MSRDVVLALVAATPGVLALIGVGVLWMTVRRVRSEQRVLLPDGTSAGLIDRQAALQRAVDRLEGGISDLQSLVERQGEVTERGLRTSLRFQGMVRYDAYRDMGGSQSWSIALLDGNHSGAVVTSLHARDHARVYMKELVEGQPGQRLSPEEERAVTLAIGAPPRPPRQADVAATDPTGEFPAPDPAPAPDDPPA